MQIPFLVLTYGDFRKSLKLFSYERDGLHTLPVFTDASRAVKFARVMTDILAKEFADDRTLHTQLCNEPRRALQMFEAITAYCPDLMRVVIDPLPPVRDDEAATDNAFVSWVENFQDIDDALEEIQDWVSTEKELDSKGE